MLIKVCGMIYPDNIHEVAHLHPDFMGFELFPASPRYAGNSIDLQTLEKIPRKVKKIGVFVYEDLETIIGAVCKYDLDGVQIHGADRVKVCHELKNDNLIVIKAFSVMNIDNFKMTKAYSEVCDYFIFDIRKDVYGRVTDKKFNWNLLTEYRGEVPFLLKGHMSVEDVHLIKHFKHPKLIGVDVNSKFESEPGVKDSVKLKSFIEEIRRKEDYGLIPPKVV